MRREKYTPRPKAVKKIPLLGLRDYLHALRPEVPRAVYHSKDLDLSNVKQIDNSIPSFDNFSNFLPLVFGHHSPGIRKFCNLDRAHGEAIDNTDRIIR